MKKCDLDRLKAMAHSQLHNYIVPGLSSSLIGGGEFGKVRLFSATREQFEHITPHSHRFDFLFLVLQGWVSNSIWTHDPKVKSGDEYAMSALIYGSKPGEYSREDVGVATFSVSENRYSEGEWYGMTHNQIHSIKFSPDAEVLFFEGPQQSDSSFILEPYVDGERVPTFKVEEWMFKRGAPLDRKGEI